jgi:O-antigen biosynthesis protein
MSRSRFNPLDHVICLEQPRYCAPSRWTEHVPFVMYLIGALEPGVVVDLAPGDDALYLGFCQAIDHLKLETKAFALRSRRAAANHAETSAALDHLDEPRYARFSRVVEATSQEAASLFKERSVDLLHIDGSRAVDTVANEFQNWLLRMSEDGMVLIDCVARRSGNKDVSEFWNSLSASYPSFMFDHGPGLGVLAVGPGAALLLESLVQSTASESDRIRQFFASLGRTQRERATALRGLPEGAERRFIQFAVAAERIARLTSSLRDCRKRLAAADLQNAIFEQRSESIAWRIGDRISRAGARIAPPGSKRRGLLRSLFRALSAMRRPGSLRSIAGMLEVRAQRYRHTLPGRATVGICERLREVIDFIRFQWQIHYEPPRIPKFDSIQASIIIPAANHDTNTLACLRSIASTNPGLPFEVIVVDRCSGAQTSCALGRLPGVIVADNARLAGLAPASNRGTAIATGEYLVFLKSSITVTDGWLAHLASTFDDMRGVGLVVPKVVDPDGQLSEAGESVAGGPSEISQRTSRDPDHPRHNYARAVESCSSACMIIPRALISRLEGFDFEHLADPNAGAALAVKIRRAGYRVVYQPAAVVVERESLARDSGTASGSAARQAINPPHFRDHLCERVTPEAHGLAASSPCGPPGESVTSPSPKGRVLVIDYSLPTPDQDSGSFRMMEILKALRASVSHVTFVPADLAHRTPYVQNLQRIGIEVVYQPYYQSVTDYLAEQGREFGLVILSRADVATRFVESVRELAPRAKVLFDTVDLHFLREGRAALLLDTFRLRMRARRRKRQELAIASQCDATLVVSPLEQAILERECAGIDVRVLSNIMEVPSEAPPGYEGRQHVLFIGGFAHAPNVDAVVYFVEEILPLVVKRLPEVVFLIVGSNVPEQVRVLASKNVRVLGYVQDVKPIFDQTRVAVAPLRFGAGVKGKVNQSMAHGVPTVVSDIAAEGMHLVHEHNAMIAGDPVAFADATVRLWTSQALWERISANGRENVREHFSVERASRQIEKLLAFAGLGGPSKSAAIECGLSALCSAHA